MNVDSTKKLNFVYEWMGPRGPITNNRIPTLVDFVTSSFSVDLVKKGYNHDAIQTPHFYERFKKNVRFYPPNCIPNEPFFYELNFHNYHYRDIFGSFKDNDGLLEDTRVSHEVVDRILNRTAYLLITLLHEGYMGDQFLMAMTNYFKNKKVPLSQIVYVSNCQNGHEIYEDFCKRNNIVPEMKIEYFPVFRFDKCDIEEAIKLSDPYIPRKRNKKFLCFNRRYNEHRLLVYLDFFKRNLLSDTFMSMANVQPESGKSFIENAKHFIDLHKPFNFTMEDVYDSSVHLPLTLDTSNFSKYPMESGIDEVLHFYQNSYINIVTETYFFNNIRHITEKTYKPIAFMQPFIIFAAPGTLQHLRDLGFKTFDKFWDESYDNELDHEKRFLKIMSVIESISKWPETRLIELTYAVKDIVEYNKNHLITMEDVEVLNFLNKYGS
jgi:hypothetical protein